MSEHKTLCTWTFFTTMLLKRVHRHKTSVRFARISCYAYHRLATKTSIATCISMAYFHRYTVSVHIVFSVWETERERENIRCVLNITIFGHFTWIEFNFISKWFLLGESWLPKYISARYILEHCIPIFHISTHSTSLNCIHFTDFFLVSTLFLEMILFLEIWFNH